MEMADEKKIRLFADTGRRYLLLFGSFRLWPHERLLERDGHRIPLGDRALDILIELVENAGTIVTKKDLIARAWKDLNVEEVNLRVRIAEIRKALGKDWKEVRHISNVPGRGYCFVAPVADGSYSEHRSPETRFCGFPRTLPYLGTRPIGLGGSIQRIMDRLATDRFVTLAGAGGVGKTTLAISVCKEISKCLFESVYFVDLGSCSIPALLPNIVALVLGLPDNADDQIPIITAAFYNRRILLVLDGCEHVIDAAASLTERLVKETMQIHVLATSRESLRVHGEYIYRLNPLDCPPVGKNLSAIEALKYPAIQHFVERAKASLTTFELDDANAPIVAGICDKLDGIALAIEVAANAVGVYGLRETADLLDDQFEALENSSRAIIPRHRTLKANLDWSYNLLSDAERSALQSLAALKGSFALDAVYSVLSKCGFGRRQAVEMIGALVSKSLVFVKIDSPSTSYRLLGMTRSYVLAKQMVGNHPDQTSGDYPAHQLPASGYIASLTSAASPLSVQGPPSRRLPSLFRELSQ